MSLGPHLWSEFEAPRAELLKGLRIPIPNPTPLLALAPVFREVSRIASEQILNDLNFHIESVQKLIDEFTAAKRHLEISAARVHTSLAPIAGLMPALLSDIFVLAVEERPYGYQKSITTISSVCSSWHAIINDRSELFARWELTSKRKASNAEMINTWRARAKERPLTINMSHYAIDSFVQSIERGTRLVLAAPLDACKYLELDYRGYHDNRRFSGWLSNRPLEMLETLVIQADTSCWDIKPLDLARLPRLKTVRLASVVIEGLSADTVRSLACLLGGAPTWASWAPLINSCHGLQHLKLAITDYIDVDRIPISLPSLTALELGRSTPVADSSICLTTLTSLCGTYTAPDGKVTPTQFPLLSELRVLARVVPRNFDQMIIELLEARMKSSSFTRLVITGAAGELSFSGTLQSIQSRATRVKITCMDHSNIPSAWP
ncbi:hypothetical protein DL93DRAFT_609334 [Clavulina sp. PMI_390]|nr:hypothetical protein DL93DRAFT_609334 [Clavulina sp. PMI_390]